ncbi:MAG: hypothetical protein RIR70_1486 [Pseudomonadota bacterium]|jgi:hypothetical protein
MSDVEIDASLLMARFADGTVVFDMLSGDTHWLPQHAVDDIVIQSQPTPA